ncbi:restriction endonuclease subunit S [Agrobacterium tumefaciens]|uniref:restriction endonuclease subunit S n=1 Tax=Agrobacterium tumefaciens TaxID=358 RepID=UPI0021D01FC3|nr:restriction endonuclease subunit S [Agrobacterium tumefaciens]UXS11607.1 restriction endonuclease subunit S [Agrobacterium tumefaciens]UXS18973.1 restriction endonuclease subunit S [Agrobacterium tumefaciens]UXT67612.1 restriction endonuclease subunit S [Agrobacterium tumefaciens]
MSFGEDLDKLVAEHSDGLVGAHSSWQRIKLGDVATLVNGFAFKSNHFNDAVGTPLLRIRDIVRGKVETYYNAPVDDPKMPHVANGEIVVGMDGDFNSRIWTGGKALVNQRVCTLQADEQFYSQKLLAFALPAYLNMINDHTSSVTVKHLSSKTVQDIPLPLPPLNEQQRIVEKIETLFAQLDKGEEALREVQKLLTRYRQSVLKAAVTGELTANWRAERAGQLEDGRSLLNSILQNRREKWSGRGKYKEPKTPSITDLPTLPESWLWTSMDALVIRGPQNGIYLPQEKYGDGTPIIRIDDFQTGWVRAVKKLRKVTATSEEIETYSLMNGDFVINRVNSVTHLGKTMLVGPEHEGALFESNMMRCSVSPYLDPPYLELYLSSAIGRKRLIKNCKHAVNQASINQGDVGTTPVPLPPLDEQREIAVLAKERLARTDILVEWCEIELKRSGSLRQSILKDAFAGKLVPQDPSDEPASALLARIVAQQPTAKNSARRRHA